MRWQRAKANLPASELLAGKMKLKVSSEMIEDKS
jgi:hypothetical protein